MRGQSKRILMSSSSGGPGGGGGGSGHSAMSKPKKRRKKLIIKSFARKPKPPSDFETETWKRLEEGIRAIFQKKESEAKTPRRAKTAKYLPFKDNPIQQQK